MSRRNAIGICLFVAAGVLLATACARPGRVHGIAVTGFLEDYSHLERGQAGQARLIFVDVHADFSGYNAIIVDPVEAIGVSPDLARHAQELDAQLREQLALAFQLTTEPGPGVAHLRLALTRATTRRIGIECEVLDSATNRQLIAAVADQTPASIDQPDASSDEKIAFALARWAELIRMRLATFRDFDAGEKAIDGAR
jgi:hypothetical protein